jgi:hypothetical protein
MDPVSTLASYAAVGALLAATLALFTGNEDDGARWMLRGTVVGGIAGLVVVVSRGIL